MPALITVDEFERNVICTKIVVFQNNQSIFYRAVLRIESLIDDRNVICEGPLVVVMMSVAVVVAVLYICSDPQTIGEFPHKWHMVGVVWLLNMRFWLKYGNESLVDDGLVLY